MQRIEVPRYMLSFVAMDCLVNIFSLQMWHVKNLLVAGDAHSMTAPLPDGDGAYRAMRRALEVANVAAEDVQYINAHATSTPLGFFSLVLFKEL
jgi:hypothetical protein